MITESKLAQLEMLAEKRVAARDEKRRKLVDLFVEMKERRDADLFALKGDEALTELVTALSRSTIRKMYLAQQSMNTRLDP